MWRRSDGEEGARGGTGGRTCGKSVLLWEIREAFMVEMAFDLNFAGRRVSHKWRRKVAKHVL